MSFWNLIPSNFDGIAIEIGSFPVHWYGLMYLFAFATCFALIVHTNKKEQLGLTKEQLDSFLTWVILGIILGARFGYVFFYQPGYYLSHPLEIIMPFKSDAMGMHFTGISGMSYHGGLIGSIITVCICMYKNKMPFRTTINLGFFAVPLGYTWGRWGNFVNGELFGEVTTSPIGMWFPQAHDSPITAPILHHPSQLYEMVFEGIVLFVILYFLRKKPMFRNQMMSVYLMGYGLFRFFIEFFRRPDAHLGRVDLFGMSRGQTLCSVMVIAGIALFIWNYRLDKKKGLLEPSQDSKK